MTNIIIFTTRRINRESSTDLFHHERDECESISIGENLKRVWKESISKDSVIYNDFFRDYFIRNFKDNPEVLYEKIDDLEDFIIEEFKNYFKEKTYEKAADDLLELIKNKNLIKGKKIAGIDLETPLLEYYFEKKPHYDKYKQIIRIRDENVFASMHSPEYFNKEERLDFIEALFDDVCGILGITEKNKIDRVLLLLHDDDINYPVITNELIAPKKEEFKKIKKRLSSDDNFKVYAFCHEEANNVIFWFLSRFPWKEKDDRGTTVEKIICEKLERLETRKAVYEIREEIMFRLYTLKYSRVSYLQKDESIIKLKEKIKEMKLKGYENDEANKKWEDIKYMINNIGNGKTIAEFLNEINISFVDLLTNLKSSIFS